MTTYKKTKILTSRQLETLEKINRSMEKYNKILINCAVSYGKTVIFNSLIIDKLNEHVINDSLILVLSDRILLTNQSYNRLLIDGNIDKNSDVVINLNEYNITNNTRVVYSTCQTIKNNIDIIKRAKIIIVDEAHGSMSNTYQYIFSKVKTDCKILGFTATPERTDKQSLMSFYEVIADEISLKELLKMDMVCNHSVINRDFNGISLLEDIAEDYTNVRVSIIKMCGYIKTLFYCKNKKLCENLEKELNNRQITAKRVGCDISKSVNKKTIQDFKNDKIECLINVNMLSEGIDIPSINCLIFTYKLNNKKTTLQKSGRAVRLFKKKLKSYLIFYQGMLEGHEKPTDIIIDPYVKNIVLNKKHIIKKINITNSLQTEDNKSCIYSSIESFLKDDFSKYKKILNVNNLSEGVKVLLEKFKNTTPLIGGMKIAIGCYSSVFYDTKTLDSICFNIVHLNKEANCKFNNGLYFLLIKNIKETGEYDTLLLKFSKENILLIIYIYTLLTQYNNLDIKQYTKVAKNLTKFEKDKFNLFFYKISSIANYIKNNKNFIFVVGKIINSIIESKKDIMK